MPGNNYNGSNKNNQPRPNRDLVNDAIHFPTVLVIGPDGESLGQMSSRDALDKATELNLDLYCVAPNGNPPVCKILNYNKFRYEQKRKERDQRKNQKVTEIKEIQLTPQIGIHDLEIKAKKAIEFLDAGNRVKIRVVFRGRQLTHPEVGQDTLDKFIEFVSDYGELEKPAVLEGRWLNGVIIPKKKK